MTVLLRSITRGLSRAFAAPRLLLGLWLLNLLVALPAAVVLSTQIADDVGASLFHRTLRQGFDSEWYAEFEHRAEGLATTFSPSIIGAGAIYDNLEGWWSGEMWKGFPGLVGLGIVYALLFTLVLGGVLDRLRHPGQSPGTERFLAASGRYFGRFLCLALVSGALYFLIFAGMRWLFRRIDSATRDVTAETTIFLWVLVVAGLGVLLLHAVRLVFDYAKVVVVVENHPNALAAAWRGLRFVLAHPGRTIGSYLGLGGLVLVLIALYALLAPGAGQAAVVTIVLAFLVGQVYLLARLFLRLAFLATELGIYEDLTGR